MLIENDLDHPCKKTCSGWQQGFEKGAQSGDDPRIAMASEIIEARDEDIRKLKEESNRISRDHISIYQENISLKEKLRVAREALIYYSHIYPEQDVPYYCEKAKEAIAKLNSNGGVV